MGQNSESEVSHKRCAVCSSLLDSEYAFQKYGWPQDNTYMPSSTNHLDVVRDFRPYGSRKLQLQQCPACGTYYLYRTDYEYLVGGSEDEEFLSRLTPAEAAEYLSKPAEYEGDTGPIKPPQP